MGQKKTFKVRVWDEIVEWRGYDLELQANSHEEALEIAKAGDHDEEMYYEHNSDDCEGTGRHEAFAEDADTGEEKHLFWKEATQMEIERNKYRKAIEDALSYLRECDVVKDDLENYPNSDISVGVGFLLETGL